MDYLKSNNSATVFTKISNINFDNFYNHTTRPLFHCAMWLFFGALLSLNYFLEFNLSVKSSFLLTVRATVNNMVVFYLFFYAFPKILSLKSWLTNIVWLVLSFMIIIVVWLVINHLQFLLFYKMSWDIPEPPFTGLIAKNAKLPFGVVISPKNILGNANLVIFSFMPSFFVKLMFDITRLYSKMLKVEKHRSELEIKNINIEKDFLKSQLNPHFLFNTLNNLYGLSKKKDDEAPGLILNLSDVMSYTLYNSNVEKVPIEKELDFIRNYFSLERMRYPTETDIKLNIAQGKHKLFIAPLLCFTFIENGFKYGLKSLNHPFLHITIDIVGNTFTFRQINDKNNTVETAKAEVGGIGIQNARKRLQLLYPEKHTLKIEQNADSFEILMQIILD